MSELISVDSKYQVAVEMALGATLQNIVTNTEQDAKKLVEYLRENKLGRASFLPIVLSHLNTAFLQEARYSRASILPFPVIFGF